MDKEVAYTIVVIKYLSDELLEEQDYSDRYFKAKSDAMKKVKRDGG